MKKGWSEKANPPKISILNIIEVPFNTPFLTKNKITAEQFYFEKYYISITFVTRLYYKHIDKEGLIYGSQFSCNQSFKYDCHAQTSSRSSSSKLCLNILPVDQLWVVLKQLGKPGMVAVLTACERKPDDDD